MNVRILNKQLADDVVVATVVPTKKKLAKASSYGKFYTTLATFKGVDIDAAVDAAWAWADANGHIVVEA